MNNYFQDGDPIWTFATDPVLSLLLLGMMPSPSAAAQARLRALVQGEMDWPRLLQLAQTHHVLALLYQRLSALGEDILPAAVLNQMRRPYQEAVVKNLLLTAEMVQVLKLMAAEGIDALPYKGPVLAQALYHQVDLRQFGDLDIIVSPEAMPAVEQLLKRQGYRPYFGEKTAAELQAYMQAKAEHTYDFFHDHKGVLLEIHWRFWPVFFSTVNPQQIWHRRQTMTWHGTTVSTLAMEDYLLILCMHGSRHLWCRLSWLCDIAQLLHQYPQLDWHQVLTQADDWGCKRMLYLGLYLARHWLAAPLPPALEQWLERDATLATLAAQVDQRAFGLAASPRRWMGMTRYQLQVRERLQDKAVYAQSLLYWLVKGRLSASV